MSVSSLAFKARTGAGVQTQSVAVTITGSGVAYLGAAYTGGQTQPSWLQLNITGSASTYQMGVNVQPGGMAPGRYSTTFQVGTADSGGNILSHQDFTVTFEVDQGVAIVNPPPTPFNFVFGTTPGTQLYAINVAAGSQQWTVASTAAWLHAPPGTQTGTGSVSVTIDATGLVPGTYTGTLSAVDAADSTDVSTVTFFLNVTPGPLTVAGTASSSGFIFGDMPPTQTFAVNVTTTQLQQWIVTSDAAWLHVPSSTSTGSGSFDEIVDATGLAPGSYTAHVQVAKSPDGLSPSTLPFTLTVTAPSLTVTEAAYAFGGDDGLAVLTALGVHFSLSTGRASYPFSVTLTTDSGGNWLTVDHSSGSVGAGGTSVNLSVNPATLRGGTYTGEIHVTTNVNGMIFDEARPVTLNIEANRIVVSASGVGLTKIAGRSVLTRTVKVLSAIGRTDTPWSATSDSSWLTVTPSGVTGGDLVLAADPTGAPADTTQFANVTITSSDSTVENQQSIRVGLFVSNTAPVDADLSTGANALATSPVEPIIAVGSGSTSVGIYDVNSGALLRTLASAAATTGALAFSEDGQSLFVYDSTNFRVNQLDAATGAKIAAFDASGTTPGGAAGSAITTMHPNGYPMLIASGGRAYDLGSGRLFTSNSLNFAALGLTRSFDQTMLATESGANFHIVRSALNGGTLVVRAGVGVSTAEGRAGESCFSVSGDRIYTASGYPYNFPATSLSSGLIIQTLPGTNYPNSIQCVWNGLVIGGVDGYYATNDIFVYDGPSGVGLAQMSSNGKPGAYRDLEDRGMAVSADGTRLVSAWLGSPGGTPMGVHFASLPAPPP
jgi:hypothetical protein